MALSRGVHPDPWHSLECDQKSCRHTLSFYAKWKTGVYMERPGGEYSASHCRTQQIDQDLQECITRDAVGVGCLHCWHVPNVWPKREQVCFDIICRT